MTKTQTHNTPTVRMPIDYEWPKDIYVPELEVVSIDKLKKFLSNSGFFPIKAKDYIDVDYETEDDNSAKLANVCSSSKQLQVKPNSLPVSVIHIVKELSLYEHAKIALDNVIQFITPYSEQAWADAYKRIGFEIGKSQPSVQIRMHCISAEIFTISQNNAWNIVHDMGDTYIYNGSFWVKLEHKQALHFVRDVSMQMGLKRYEVMGSKYADELYKEVIYSGVLDKTQVSTEKLLLNMQNGTLHIANDGIELKGFDEKDFLKYQLGFEYDATAINSQWLDFLNTVLPETDSQKTLQQALGSLLLRGIKLEKLILLYGRGANGKSVIFEVLNGLLGEDSISNYSLNSLTDSKGYHRSNLKDKLINYASDIDLSKVEAGTMKTLVSGEAIECRLPYKESFIMKDYAKMIFNLNDVSTAKIENTKGFYRRFLFIPFEVEIEKSQQDKNLHKKLLQNKAGILNWLLDGAKEVLEAGEIFESQETQDFLLHFQSQPTPLEKFLLSRNVTVDTKNSILSSTLYQYYTDMCQEDGVKQISQIKFSKQLAGKGYENTRTSEGVHWHVSCDL